MAWANTSLPADGDAVACDGAVGSNRRHFAAQHRVLGERLLPLPFQFIEPRPEPLAIGAARHGLAHHRGDEVQAVDDLVWPAPFRGGLDNQRTARAVGAERHDGAGFRAEIRQ